ncbi:MAG TPA: hypothetical protein VE976_05785 [Actinomycetota bacterium]|nr:hypothetical protein [Actinomycetota bacterium]
MRRGLGVVLGALLVLSLGGTAAEARKPYHEKYQTTWVNVFWHSRERVDQDTFLRITWYAGAYDSGDEGFWSDAYRWVEQCQKGADRTRCHYQRGKSWYGYTTSTANNTFTLDKRLTDGRLDARYKLYRTAHRDRILVGTFHIVSDVAGTGDLTHGRSSWTQHEGCTTYQYSGTYRSRDGTATGTLARGHQAARDLGDTDDAYIGANQNVEIDHTC